MSVVRWEPFNETVALRDVMNRLMENAVISPRVPFNGGAGRHLPMDVYETPDELVVRAAIPGITPDQVNISWEQGALTIRATVPEPALGGENKEQGTWHLHETFHGEFVRSLQLPGTFDPGKAVAEYENGMLTLRVPRSEAAKPRQIQVRGVAKK
jgi:HSP20 family protein